MMSNADQRATEERGTFRTHNPKRRVELLEARIKELEEENAQLAADARLFEDLYTGRCE